jgi:hypothetical protein
MQAGSFCAGSRNGKPAGVLAGFLLRNLLLCLFDSILSLPLTKSPKLYSMSQILFFWYQCGDRKSPARTAPA